MSRMIGIHFAGTLALLLAGCGDGSSDQPDLGDVEGTVTLDGQPLEGATVTFTPVDAETGRPSSGTTDADGEYELGYSLDAEGAMIGKHIVRITTGRAADEDEEGNPTPAVPEKVPVEYNRDASENPEMTVEVKSGGNTLDFALKSGGEVLPPVTDDQ